MKRIILGALLLVNGTVNATVNATAPGATVGYLLFTFEKHVYQQIGEDGPNPLAPKSRSGRVHFAVPLEATDTMQKNQRPLWLRTLYRLGPVRSGARVVFLIRVDRATTDGKLLATNSAFGVERILGSLVSAGDERADVMVRFPRWEDLDVETNLRFNRNVSGANFGVRTEFVDTNDSRIGTAIVTRVRRAGIASPWRNELGHMSDCGEYLGHVSTEVFY